jgi:hypothetical protein
MGASIFSIQEFLKMRRGKRKLLTRTKVTDLAFLNQFCKGNVHRMKNYIGLFLSGTPFLVTSLETALEQNDPGEIFRLLYSSKMKWIMMGMVKTEKLSADIIHHCQHIHDLQSERVRIQQLISELNTALAELKLINEIDL